MLLYIYFASQAHLNPKLVVPKVFVGIQEDLHAIAGAIPGARICREQQN